MTDGAVLADRIMFKNERTLVTGMALKAKIIETFIRLQVLDRGTVIGMAVTADHLAFLDRMVGRIVHFSPFKLMALVAESRLGFFQ